MTLISYIKNYLPLTMPFRAFSLTDLIKPPGFCTGSGVSASSAFALSGTIQ
jgi:hypothetical protein